MLPRPETPVVLYVAAAFVGSVIFPIYALNVAHANDRAQPDEYVEVSQMQRGAAFMQRLIEVMAED